MTNPMGERPLHVEGLSPDDDDASIPEVEEHLHDDPDTEPSLPETDPGTTLVEGELVEPTDEQGADRLSGTPDDPADDPADH